MPYANDHKEQTKDRILNTAIELFSRYGFDKISIGQIMQASRMTHGAFYAHFESKEALFRASFLETLHRSRAARLVKGPLSVKHLTSLVTNYWNLGEWAKNARPGPETILFNESGNQNATVKGLFEESYEHLKHIVEVRLIALGKLKKLPFEISENTVAQKSRAILSLLVGAVVVAKTIPSEIEAQNILESAQTQILQMLGFSAEA